MIPSRGRKDRLDAAIQSFINTATDKDCFEFIIKIDSDDLHSMPTIKPNMKIIISDRENGYESIHDFCNMMIKLSDSSWVMLGNDDIKMTTIGWDEVLKKEIVQNKLLLPSEVFPIVNNQWCKKVGFFSLNAYTDRWLNVIFIGADLIKIIPINIEHELITDDITHEDRRAAGATRSDFDWENTKDIRTQLINDLKNG